MMGIIILAAGKSERLGRPKQLVAFNGSNLLNHSVSCALPVGNTVIVLGANTGQIMPNLMPSDAIVVQNSNWQEGMAASIRMGLQALIDIHPETQAVILMACDQPFITQSHLSAIVDLANRCEQNIIVSTYADTTGIPVLFKKKYFKMLSELKGDKGAHSILAKHPDDVVRIAFEKGEIDIDTPEDEESLKRLYI